MSKEFKRGKSFRFRSQLIYPEGGLICIEDQNTGDFRVITRAEAAARAVALNAELKYCHLPSDRDELCSCVCNLCEAIKDAKQQGDPSDPEVAKKLMKDQRVVSLVLGVENQTKSSFSSSNEVAAKQSSLLSGSGGYILGKPKIKV